MMEKKRILVVEDEKRLADILKDSLEEIGFEVDCAYDGYIGKTMAQKTYYNLIILDVNIPLINGYELCKEIRINNASVPIIMLTAMGEPENKLTGFDVGADDYIIKPFDFKELIARINVFLRRSTAPVEPVIENFIKIDTLVINRSTKTVFREGTRVDLTAKEFMLLEYLALNKGIVVSRADIAEKIWDLNFNTGTNYIDVYINYLRRKIDKDHEVKLIHTRVGLGYVLRDPND